MKTTPFVYALLAALSWGIAPIFAKVALKKIDSETAIVIRQIIIALTLFSVTLLSGRINKLVETDIRSVFFMVIAHQKCT